MHNIPTKKTAMWKPKEIFINNQVKDDLVSRNIVKQCPESIVHYTSSGLAHDIKAVFQVLKNKATLLEQVIAGKGIVYVGTVGQNDVDYYSMPDQLMNCFAFAR